ncbi:hypothetical protein, partial [Guyparkeria sp.]|uniref:hypothetical protein n=1 Tax=Guyparkeria sp. TaxID=2035736 RepID=UPI003970ED53
MRGLVRFGFLAALALLVACDPDAAPQLHDVTITGVVDARLGYLYGEPRSFTLDGETVTLPNTLATQQLRIQFVCWMNCTSSSLSRARCVSSSASSFITRPAFAS